MTSMKCTICNHSMELYLSGDYTSCGVKNYLFEEFQCSNCELLATSPPPTNEVYPMSRDEDGNFLPDIIGDRDKILRKRVYVKDGI